MGVLKPRFLQSSMNPNSSWEGTAWLNTPLHKGIREGPVIGHVRYKATFLYHYRNFPPPNHCQSALCPSLLLQELPASPLPFSLCSACLLCYRNFWLMLLSSSCLPRYVLTCYWSISQSARILLHDWFLPAHEIPISGRSQMPFLLLSFLFPPEWILSVPINKVF